MKPNIYYVIRVSLIVALGGFLMGFDASVISGVVKFIEPHFDLTKIQLGWAVSCLTLTSTLAIMIAGPVSDIIGRKKVLIIASVLYAISAIFSALAPSFVMLVIARMIGGLGVGSSLLIAPMYIAEISPPTLRGRMVSFNQLNIVIGISVAFFTNYLILQLGKSEILWAQTLKLGPYNWRWMLGLETLPAILYFFALFAVPESPRWLSLKSKFDRALDILKKTVPVDEAEYELEEIKKSLKHSDKKERVPLSTLFKPALRLVLLIGIVIAVIQQITGINSVFFYAPMIFEQSGIGTDAAFSQAILVGLTNLVFTIIAIWLVDKLGRKPLLGFGLAGIAISMFILAGGFNAAKYELTREKLETLNSNVPVEKLYVLEDKVFTSDVKFKKALASLLDENEIKAHQTAIVTAAIQIRAGLILFGILAFVASFAISVGPVMWVLFSELFPNWIRGIAVSFVGFINSAISFLVQLVFPWELANWGNSLTFLIYGIFGAIGFIFIMAILPETKGKSLEELEKILVKNE